MTAEKIKRTVAGCFRLLLLILRYVAAPLVSFVISFAAVVAGGVFIGSLRLGQVGFTLLCGVVGFCGVIAGTRILPPVSRRFGSIGLLFLGLIYFWNFVADWGNQITDEGKVINIDKLWVMRTIFLALGGALATVVVWKWSSWNKSLEPAACPSSIDC